MKRNILLVSIVIALITGSGYAACPVLVEMPMTEPWESLPDTPEIAVIWFSDISAILAVSPAGEAILDTHEIKFEMLDEMCSDRDYYVVSSRTNMLPIEMRGQKLKTDHFLVSTPTGKELQPSRDLGYQKLWPSKNPISTLHPPVYQGYVSRDYNLTIQALVDQVTEAEYLGYLVDLVGFVTRYSRAAQCVQAANWAKSEFESWGYEVELFDHTSGMAPNVIARKEGLFNPERIWVVGGHLDSTSETPSANAPGADDNGTGAALTLCCAHILKDMSFADTVIYTLWTGEEQGLYGSSAWASWAKSQGLNILGYYNFDMIGWEDPAPEDLDVLANVASYDFGLDFVTVADMYTSLLHDLQQSNVTASDHYSFWQNGYVAFCGIEDYWPSYPYYHTIQDTVDKVSIPFATEVTRAMVANICTAAQIAESLYFKQSLAACNSRLEITAIDMDASGSIPVSIYSGTEPTPETILLAETASNVFSGYIQVTDAPPVHGDEQISVVHGDMIIATYAGASNAAEIDVDCVAPVISNVTVMELSSKSALISFKTDETSTAQIRYGKTTPDSVVAGDIPGTMHSILLENLEQCTLYYFQVEATDLAGNETIATAGGSYYFFITFERVVTMEANMDVNPGWTYEPDWNWGQPTGQGGQYGSPDPNSGYTGNNVVGYNLNGDYPNSMSTTKWATTQAFDCSDADRVTLEFRVWLGVEQSSYDHAYIAVSNNNGGSWTNFWQNSSTLSGGTWELWEFDLTNYAVGQSQVKIRWGMGPTDSGWRYCGWNIDDVVVFLERPCEIATPTPAPTVTPDDCLHTGDVSQDGTISSEDAQLAFQIALGQYSPTYFEACAADCNGDDTVSSSDAQMIFQAALGSGTCVDPL